MALTLDKIEVKTDYMHLNIREITESGLYNRRVLTPDMALAEDEHKAVKDKVEELWTDEVKSAWANFQAEQKAKISPE
tara:strand:- start:359 stop:592 length:234 start_codon:yes stop_codon:yes gene_type:complete